MLFCYVGFVLSFGDVLGCGVGLIWRVVLRLIVGLRDFGWGIVGLCGYSFCCDRVLAVYCWHLDVLLLPFIRLLGLGVDWF